MPRQARLDTPGTLHHVIIRGIEKGKIVDDQNDQQNFVDRMGDLSIQTKTYIYAWALMTNHAHILLRSGPKGISTFMRRLLTGYAIWYNRRHDRHGYLFQNRYKSIVCEEDTYFKELVRYIHLNPLRVGLVKKIKELDQYPWCGHSFIMGERLNDWQDINYLLGWFGTKEADARQEYRNYIEDGVDQGRRPELVGGGLLRSNGGWSAVKSIRSLGIQKKSDDRILGNSEFVEKVIEEAEYTIRYQIPENKILDIIQNVIINECKKAKINIEALKGGSRCRDISKVRHKIANELVKKWGISQAEVARHLGVSTSAISLLL